GDAVRQTLSHFAAALHHARQVEAHIVGAKPELRGALYRVIKLRGAEECLGGDAAPVEADAAEMLALDDRSLEPELRGADCSDIAAGSRADDGEIETRLAHRKDARTIAANMGVKLTRWGKRSIRRRSYFSLETGPTCGQGQLRHAGSAIARARRE